MEAYPVAAHRATEWRRSVLADAKERLTLLGDSATDNNSATTGTAPIARFISLGFIPISTATMKGSELACSCHAVMAPRAPTSGLYRVAGSPRLHVSLQSPLFGYPSYDLRPG